MEKAGCEVSPPPGAGAAGGFRDRLHGERGIEGGPKAPLRKLSTPRSRARWFSAPEPQVVLLCTASAARPTEMGTGGWSRLVFGAEGRLVPVLALLACCSPVPTSGTGNWERRLCVVRVVFGAPASGGGSSGWLREDAV